MAINNPMSAPHQGHIMWNTAKVATLRRMLATARDKGNKEIVFEEKVILVPYGEYLVEHLENELATNAAKH